MEGEGVRVEQGKSIMPRSMRLTAALLAAVIALAAFIHFKPAKDAPVEYPLSALRPAESRSIRIERAGAQPILLERKQDSWIITAPFTARADDLRVRQLLEILEARAANRLAAADLARFELERPAVQVTVDGQSFGFGMVSPFTREQYVLTSGAVYAVSPRYGATLPTGAADLTSRQLFGTGEIPIRFGLKTFTVEQRDGKWRQTPAASDLSQDDFVRWVDEWRRAAALRVEPQGKSKPLVELRVHLRDGGTLTLGLLAREPELVLLRADEKLQYHFRADAGKRLLSPPNAAREEPAANK
jgi:Domain of unknown function (DUF4340)